MSPTDPDTISRAAQDGPHDHRAPPHPSTQIFFGNEGLRPGWGLLLFGALFFGIGYPAQYATARLTHLPTETRTQQNSPPPVQTPQTTIPLEATTLLTVLVATALLSRIERRPVGAYGLPAPKPRAFLRGIFSGLGSLTLLLATLTLTGHLHIDGRLLPTLAALRYAAIWAIGFACVAGLEETLLRGYAQYTLTRALTPLVEVLSSTPRSKTYAFWIAASILSFLFGLGHTGNPGESPIGVLSAGLFGLVLCLSLYRTGSLWWALGFHASWDWAQSFLYGVPDSGTLFEGRLLATHPSGPAILSGGLTGPEGSILILPTLALVTAIILLTLPQRPESHP